MPHPREPQTVSVTFAPDVDAFCPTCDYNLRGMSGSSCPECGERFTLAKPARKSHYALYLLGLMCTTSLAFASTSIIFYVILHVRGIFSFQTDTILLITHSLYVIAIPYLIVLLVYRRRLVKSTLPVQLACSAPPVVLLFAFNVWAIIRAFTL